VKANRSAGAERTPSFARSLRGDGGSWASASKKSVTAEQAEKNKKEQDRTR
jgi:hypothetical protein